MIYFFAPLICVALTMIFWAIHSTIKKEWRKFRSRTISTVIVIFFLIHPSVSRMMFKPFNCLKIENDSRMMADLGEICYEGKHLSVGVAISLPGLFIWVLGIPVFAFILLFR